MYKIAIVDDDELWCFAAKRYFRGNFEVSVFTKVSSFLRDSCYYDLVIVDYSIPSANYEKSVDGCQLISHLKTTLHNPPVLVLATAFVSKNDLEEIGREICPEANYFIAKDVGLEVILQQLKQLLASSKLPVTAQSR